jgi:hypothetical protein
MEKLSSERFAIFFVSILIASNMGFYILGKTMAPESGKGELVSTPLLIVIALSVIIGVSSIFRKK